MDNQLVEMTHVDTDDKPINLKQEQKSSEQRRREYHKKYYHDHVDLVAERVRKQKFYAIHREEILAKAKARYQKKKLEANGIQTSINVSINE